MADQWFAIFNGATGDLVSTGSVLTFPLNTGLRAVTVDGPQGSRFWDKNKLDWVLNAVTVPGAVGTILAVPGNGQVSLSWAAPADGGSPITGYTVAPFAGAAATALPVINTTGTTLTVPGLTNGTPYTFRVAAKNAQGAGPQSPFSSAVTPTTGVQPQGDPFPYKEEWVEGKLIFTGIQTCAANLTFTEKFDVPPLIGSIAVNYPGRAQYGAYLTFTTGNLTSTGVQICALAPQKINFTVPIVVHVVQRFREKA